MNKSITDEIRDQFWNKDVAQRNALIGDAIELALGRKVGTQPRINPYDYINRMSNLKTQEGDTVSLDGKPIIFLGPTKIARDDSILNGSFEYRILVGDQ